MYLDAWGSPGMLSLQDDQQLQTQQTALIGLAAVDEATILLHRLQQLQAQQQLQIQQAHQQALILQQQKAQAQQQALLEQQLALQAAQSAQQPFQLQSSVQVARLMSSMQAQRCGFPRDRSLGCTDAECSKSKPFLLMLPPAGTWRQAQRQWRLSVCLPRLAGMPSSSQVLQGYLACSAWHP